MADAIIQAARERPISPTVARLHLTEPLAACGDIDGVMFSGGVAEFVYGREARDFGDMGRLLGETLRRKLDAGALPWPLLPAGECIRATALGASEHSVQLSGNTIYVSNPRALLPRRNLQVLRPPLDLSGDIDPGQVEHAIRAHFTAFDLEEGKEVALAFRWGGPPAYRRLSAFAAGLVAALPNTITAGRPIYLVLDGDVAQLLGALLREELGVASEILALDGILLWDFEYVDIGRIRMPSHTVPVTVKSLVFDSDPRRAELGARAAA
jgi:ethanolamine utilization protein EutA